MPEAQPVLPLAKKLVGLAREQRQALELGAREQYDWIALRREEVTNHLSSLLAAGTVVTEQEAAALRGLRTELLTVDQAMQDHLRSALRTAASRRRNFARARKSLGSYLQAGPRHGFFDTQR